MFRFIAGIEDLRNCQQRPKFMPSQHGLYVKPRSSRRLLHRVMLTLPLSLSFSLMQRCALLFEVHNNHEHKGLIHYPYHVEYL